MLASHVTIQKGKTLPKYDQCRTCCDQFHCPFCTAEYFKPTRASSVNRHLTLHFNRAVQHEGYTIHRCGLGCRPQLHYHCIYCQSMLLRKEDFDKHLVWCKAKQSIKTPLSDACPDSAETSIPPTEPGSAIAKPCPVSTERCPTSAEPCPTRAEPCPANTDPCPASIELCPPLSEPHSLSAESSEPGVLARPKGGRVRPVVRTRCPMCNVLMNKRNIGKHIIRKHANLELFDVNATYQCIDENNGIFAVQKTFHDHRVKKKLRGENCCQSSQSQDSQLNTDIALRTSMRSYRCVQLRMSSSHPVAALCQMTATPDKEANFATGARLVEEAQAAGASMVFLPEGFDYIGSNLKQTLQLSETLSGETITRYSELARKLRVWLSLGGFHERGENWETKKRIYNSHIILNDQGDIVSVYRKGHLFDVELAEKGVSLKESSFTNPGTTLVPPVQTPIGKVGLAVCYDLRFPEHSLALLRHGAEILTYPSAFTVATGIAHWEVLLRARAVETQCYVLAAAQVGPHHPKRSSYGHALAVDPWGTVLSDLGPADSGLSLVEVDLQKLRDTRRDMPVQQHRREAEYYRSLDTD
ncbi:deaminated glutathione amidase isoform X1 [Alosa pseudoharengus]|uniref:deaminated glutathione amidase isoform X1 n=2 Tax=Alosa pseudoharengus TaxID=34774 RepID=UPI003F8A5CAD